MLANRKPLRVLLLLSWLSGRPLALQLQAEAPFEGAFITIAGRAKCGTSHLHKLLASHNAVFSLRKEQCPEYIHLEEGFFAQLLNFTASLARQDGNWKRMGYKKVRQACTDKFGPSAKESCLKFYEGALSGGAESATRVLQSCITTAGVIRMQSMVPVANARAIFLQRDPADLLWSAYNFWQGGMDAPETRNNTDWVDPWTDQRNYRSPVHFHELVASRGRLAGGVADWRAYFMIPEMHQLRQTFGNGSVLFLRSEDLQTSDAIQQICTFVGVDILGISHDLIRRKTNSQGTFETRGFGDSSPNKSGIYEVSGFQPMLCESRELIYNQSQASCSELHLEFGLRYRRCLGEAPACEPGETKNELVSMETKIAGLEAENAHLRSQLRWVR